MFRPLFYTLALLATTLRSALLLPRMPAVIT